MFMKELSATLVSYNNKSFQLYDVTYKPYSIIIVVFKPINFCLFSQLILQIRGVQVAARGQHAVLEAYAIREITMNM